MIQIAKTKLQIFNFDEERERKRLQKAFKGRQLKRQLEILDLFLNCEYEKMLDKFDKLPRCKEQECSEKEYIGWWFQVLFQGQYAGVYPKDIEMKFEKMTYTNKNIQKSWDVINVDKFVYPAKV